MWYATFSFFFFFLFFLQGHFPFIRVQVMELGQNQLESPAQELLMEDNNLSLLLCLLLGAHKCKNACMTVGVKVEVYGCPSRVDLT
jgi:hypothetical protein